MLKTHLTNQHIRLPYFCQETESYCGPAVLQMLLAHQGRSVTQDQVVQAAGISDRVSEFGARPDQLAAATRRLAPDLQLWMKQNASQEDLLSLVHLYHWPVAVNWQGLFYDTVEEQEAKNPDGEHGHYSIVADIDPRRSELLLIDPYPDFSSGPRVFALDWFERRWWDEADLSDLNSDPDAAFVSNRCMFLVAPSDMEFPRELGMVAL